MVETPVRVGVGVFVFKDGQFLMMKRKGSHGSGFWSLPGGHMEFGESWEDTARREVKEESGLEIQNLCFGAVTNDLFSEEQKHYITIWMISDWKEGEAVIAEPDKCTALEWCTFNTLPEPLFLPWKQLKDSEFYPKISKLIS
jgi:8-oxo-dGTP diphosphatase